MRKLKLQLQVSVDGYMAGPRGELNWTSWNLEPPVLNYISDLNNNIDCILLGGVPADGFIMQWETGVPGNRMASGKTHQTPAISTKNTAVTHGNLVEEINKLKRQPGRDMIIYGEAAIVSSLIEADLIDEFHLFVNPTAIGHGITVFKKLDCVKRLRLIGVEPFDCGIVALHYALSTHKLY